MFQKLLFLLIATCFFQCKSDNTVREQAVANIQSTAQKAAAAPTPAPAPAPARTDLAPGQTAPTIAQQLDLMLGTTETKAGEKACLPITASGFADLIGLQFSIRWNPEELTYTSVENFSLPDLGEQNFGATYAEKGVVALSWVHMNLQGVSLASNSPLFDICFTPKVAAGQDVEVRFEPRPTPYEVINVREQILEFKGTNGMIQVR